MSEGSIDLDLPKRLDDGAPARGLAGWARERILARLSVIEEGFLTIVDGEGCHHFGRPGDALHATVFVKDPALYECLVLRGALGVSESYMDGHWDADELASVIRIFARNRKAWEQLDGPLTALVKPSLKLFSAIRRNTREGSRRNIAAHYDLGNAFFELFLDETLAYSAGIFESPDASMYEASVAKFDRVCRKLALEPTDHLLEIGTGWGGLALHAAKHFGCRVTTTTISERQYEKARERIAAEGLEDRVEVLFEDYRDLEGQYDKLVSIEMIEAVGNDHLDSFMDCCGRLLKEDGVMALQAISIPDQMLEEHLRSIDFIKRYIFPGGELVSVGSVGRSAAHSGALRMTHLEDITPHYAETLRRWRWKMEANRTEMKRLGLDETFLRMWEYYLCYCEGGFDERSIGVFQAVFEKPGVRRGSILGRQSGLVG